MQSQIPSHASTINASPSWKANFMTSGHAVTACSQAGSSMAVLKTKSPMHLDTAMTPSMRWSMTVWPESSMRCSSLSLVGLWSCDSSTATGTPLAARQSTARESPALAQYSSFPTTRQVTAVDPLSVTAHSSSSMSSNSKFAPSAPCGMRPWSVMIVFRRRFSDCSFRICAHSFIPSGCTRFLSVRRKPSVNAFAYAPVAKCWLLTTFSWRCLPAYAATSAPPCPS
mmetsp:Transcript_8103/g.19161  ORF Transcript_8103/g.19161 Transcript_8103/m.19161 type:complete len:226 (-) Transcript_8103:392-1069(-)